MAALELTEQGFYEIRGAGRDAGPAIVAASNVSLAESNLDRMDPKELVAAVTGNGPSGSTSGQDVLPDEAQELAQRVWWYLLFAGILLLIAETVLAHRYSRATRRRSWNAFERWNREYQRWVRSMPARSCSKWSGRYAGAGASSSRCAARSGSCSPALIAIIAIAYALEALKFTPAAIFSFRIVTALVLRRRRRVVLRAAAVAQGHRRTGRALSRRARADARLHASSARWKRPSGPATGRRS